MAAANHHDSKAHSAHALRIMNALARMQDAL